MIIIIFIAIYKCTHYIDIHELLIVHRPKPFGLQLCTLICIYCFIFQGNFDIRGKYLTDLPNEKEKDDEYYIVNIEDYKRRSIRVLEGPQSTAAIKGT